MSDLATWAFGTDGLNASPDLRGGLAELAPGSRNLMPDGDRESRPFRGLTIAGNGGRHMVQLKDTWGSLDDDGANPGKGSLFSSIADMLVYIGQGRVMVEGTAIPGVLASNILRFLLKWNGLYTDPKSGPYAAGLPEPSAPVVGIVTSTIYGAPNLTGTVSIKYARLRKTTGGRSRASATSDVLVVNNNAIFAVVPPVPPSLGQTHHVFFGTSTKLGGIGLHYRIARANPFTNDEYTEADVEREVSIISVTGGDKLNALPGTFTAGDIGKLIEGVAGLTIPAGTTVTEIISDTQIKLSAVVTGTAGIIKAIAFAGGVRRSVVLNWTPADLVEETAWIYDFPPPTGSHAFQLENRMYVCAYADASTRAVETVISPDTSASSSNPGTALLGSVPNQFESYDPRYPIFLPERVVDILSDGMESYKFIGGRNGIYAAQYLNVTDAASLTLTVLLRGEGIETPNNWCARERAIYLYTGQGQPVRIIEGGIVDKTFGAKVRHLMRNWKQKDTSVFAHPRGGGAVYANGAEAFFFDEVTNRWSSALGLNDEFGGTIVSSVATQSRALITLETFPTLELVSGIRTAYYFDEGTGSFVAAVGHYQDAPNPQKMKIVQGVRAAGVADRVDKTGYLGLHKNTLQTAIEDGIMNSGSSLFTSPGGRFTQEHYASYILIKKAGSNSGFLFGRIRQVLNSSQIRLGTPESDINNSVDLPAETTISKTYALIAFRLFPFKINQLGTFEVRSGDMLIPGFSSYSMSLLMETAGVDAQPLNITLEGVPTNEEGWTLPSTGFNQTA